MTNDDLYVRYVAGDVDVCRTMTQYELAALILDDDIFLISVNESPKIVRHRKKKHKAGNSSKN